MIEPVAPSPVARPWMRLVFLGLLNAMAAFSTDTHLPALPNMVAELHATDAEGQLSLTTFVVGLALGQLVSGGLVDSHGRRRPMLAGSVVYVAAALACAFAPSIGALLGFRFVQGVGAAAGMVGARAMLRDIVTGPNAARVFSRVYLVVGVMPVIAPSVGAGLVHLGGWRTIFITMAVIGVVVLTGTARLPETLPPQYRHAGGIRPVLADWGVLVRDRTYVALVLSLALTVAAMFGYLSSAPFTLKDRFGLDPTMFALAFGFGALGFVIGNLLGGPISARGGPRRAAAVGSIGLVVSAVGLVAAVATGAGLIPYLAPVLLLFVSTGMTVPNTMALALMPYPERAGSAAALLGVSQFVIGGAIAPIIGSAGAGGWALPIYEVVVCVLALALFALAYSRTGSRSAAPSAPAPTVGRGSAPATT